MANIFLYISGQTELDDVSEFFQKRLIGEGETPVAFFDGVFYESHQERVGNIVYQDYLIYTDKALYLWARGASKDFLDRFSLGTVSVNSRNKDSAFATMNLKIRREGKEPIFVIFDMVEIREADMIVKLQTAVESIIEDYLGINYRQEIPQDTADRIFQAAKSVCPPRQISLKLDTPQAPVPDAGIGYGQDLLEQYRASTGYGQQQTPYPPYQPPGTAAGARSRSMGPQDAMRGLESMLPTDPASLKRIAEQIKHMVGDAPFKMRDQVMKDLQHVPGDMATVLTALNELLSNIAGNPLAERFIMNAIKTAVVNDGVLGSLGKIIKMTGIGSGGGKKSPKPQSQEPSREERGASSARKSPFVEEQEDDSSTIRRKKISIKDDDEHAEADLFAGSDEPISSRENRPQVSRSSGPDDDDSGAAPGGRRKKLSIKMEDDNEIARKLMSYDESEREAASPAPVEAPVIVPSAGSTENGSGIRRRKLSIKAEEGSGAKADIAQKLMSYDEASRGAVNSLSSGEVQSRIADDEQSEPEPPCKKKIQIKAEVEPEAAVSAEPEIESELEAAVLAGFEIESEPELEKPVRKKIQIKTEVEQEAVVSPEPELESVIESDPEAVAAFEPEVESEPEPEPEKPVRKKIQIKAEIEPEAVVSPELDIESEPGAEPELELKSAEAVIESVAVETEMGPDAELEERIVENIALESEAESGPEEINIPDDIIFSALGEPEIADNASESKEYMTIESDVVPVRRVVSEPVSESIAEPVKEVIAEPVIEKKPEQPRHASGKAGRGKRRGRKV